MTEKRRRSAKGRTAANRSAHRACVHDDDASSPAAAAESILLTLAPEVKEESDAITLDAPNIFLQTSMPKDDSKKGYHEAQRHVSRHVTRN